MPERKSLKGYVIGAPTNVKISLFGTPLSPFPSSLLKMSEPSWELRVSCSALRCCKLHEQPLCAPEVLTQRFRQERESRRRFTKPRESFLGRLDILLDEVTSKFVHPRACYIEKKRKKLLVVAPRCALRWEFFFLFVSRFSGTLPKIQEAPLEIATWLILPVAYACLKD